MTMVLTRNKVIGILAAAFIISCVLYSFTAPNSSAQQTEGEKLIQKVDILLTALQESSAMHEDYKEMATKAGYKGIINMEQGIQIVLISNKYEKAYNESMQYIQRHSSSGRSLNPQIVENFRESVKKALFCFNDYVNSLVSFRILDRSKIIPIPHYDEIMQENF